MSALPNRTQILIKDLIFQEKYHLTHSQTDLMAYLVNVVYWAININGYSVIATSKIMTDLPTMRKKTIEASLKVLKDLDLIECTIVKVTQWKGKPRLRGMKLTQKGKEYNAKLVLPPQDERVRALEKENRELRETIKDLRVSESEVSAPKKEVNQEARQKPSVLSMPTLKAIEIFVGEVTKRFGRGGQPICNGVPKWNKETTFYINSYNKLSVITPQKEHKQLKNPFEINRFWEWLSVHNERIGDKIDFDKTPTIKELEKRFLNQIVMIGTHKEKIYEFILFEDGVKIKVESEDGKVRFIIDSSTKKEKIFGLGESQKVLFELLLSHPY